MRPISMVFRLEIKKQKRFTRQHAIYLSFHEEIKAFASIEQTTDSAAARERQVALG